MNELVTSSTPKSIFLWLVHGQVLLSIFSVPMLFYLKMASVLLPNEMLYPCAHKKYMALRSSIKVTHSFCRGVEPHGSQSYSLPI